MVGAGRHCGITPSPKSAKPPALDPIMILKTVADARYLREKVRADYLDAGLSTEKAKVVAIRKHA